MIIARQWMFYGRRLPTTINVFEMIWRLLNRWDVREKFIARTCPTFAQKTGFTAFAYKGRTP